MHGASSKKSETAESAQGPHPTQTMSAERWQQIDRLFQQAVLLPAAEQTEFLRQHCGHEQELHSAVAIWLQHDRLAEAEGFLATLVPTESKERETPLEERVDPLVGRLLGSYTIVERIAAGAMGVVYRGQRSEGFQQDVAIKVLRAWLSDDMTVARFRAEQRALADLPHPNIARFLDAGVTDDGSHYLILEYIPGYRLDEAVAALRPSREIQLKWFLTICRAVAFAHERGIAHRDLKPANILMMSTAQRGDARDASPDRGDSPSAQALSADQLSPKITDFGLAKFVEQARDGLTATGDIMGTPGYMAPEQLLPTGSVSGIATDVYGLGAVLYFLLAGRPPYRCQSMTELVREMTERDPEEPASLHPGISADLNTICLKCLRSSPAERYASAGELADDVQRHLAGHPIHARPIGTWGRLTRWALRNRKTAALMASLLATLLVGLVATTSLYLVASARQAEAERERRGALETIDRLMTEVAKSLRQHPESAPSRKMLLEAANEAYRARLAADDGKDRLLKYEAAVATFRLAQMYDPAEARERRVSLASDAMARFGELAEQYPDDTRYRFDIFHCLLTLGRQQDALTQIRAICRDDPSFDYREALASAACGVAAGLVNSKPPSRDVLNEAERLARESIEVWQTLKAEDPHDIRVRRGIGRGLLTLGRILACGQNDAEALPLFEDAIAHHEQLVATVPHEHPFSDELQDMLVSAGFAWTRQGGGVRADEHFARASQLSREWTQIEPRVLSCWIAHIRNLLQQIHWYHGDWQPPSAEFTRLLEELRGSLQFARRFWPNTPVFVPWEIELLCDAPILEMRDIDAAQDLIPSADEPPEDSGTGDGHFVLGLWNLRSGRPKEAMQWLAPWDLEPDPTWARGLRHQLTTALALAANDDFSKADVILEKLKPYRQTQVYRRNAAEIDQLKKQKGIDRQK